GRRPGGDPWWNGGPSGAELDETRRERVEQLVEVEQADDVRLAKEEEAGAVHADVAPTVGSAACAIALPFVVGSVGGASGGGSFASSGSAVSMAVGETRFFSCAASAS